MTDGAKKLRRFAGQLVGSSKRRWRSGGWRGCERKVVVGGNYVLHKLEADGADVLAQRRAEHHDLLLVGGVAEDLLHISTHVELLEHLVALVEHKMFDVLQLELARPDQGQNSARGANDHVWTAALQQFLVVADVHATEENANSHRLQVLRKPLVFL